MSTTYKYAPLENYTRVNFKYQFAKISCAYELIRQ